MKMSTSIPIFLLTFSFFSSENLPGMAESLKDECISTILQHPEALLKNPQKASNIPFEVEDAIRRQWFSSHDMTDAWWAELCAKNLVKVAEISALKPIKLNHEHSIIKTKTVINTDGDSATIFYNINGKTLYDPSSIWSQTRPVFIPEHGNSDVDEGHLASLGFKPRHKWQVGFEGKKTKHNALIVRRINTAKIFDLNLYDTFLDYAEERMPLVQVLLLQIFEHAFEQAHNKNSKIALSPDEWEILNGMPPKFEQAIKFLKSHVE